MGDDFRTECFVCNIIWVFMMTFGTLIVGFIRLLVWIVARLAIYPGRLQVAWMWGFQFHRRNLVVAFDAPYFKVFDMELVGEMYVPHR